MISLVPLLLAGLLLIGCDERGSRGSGFAEAFSSHKPAPHRLQNHGLGAPASTRRRPNQLLQSNLRNDASDLPNSLAKLLTRRRKTAAADPSSNADSTTRTRLALQLPKAADNVKDTVHKSFNFVGHVDRFLGSLLFQKDTLSECVVQAVQSLLLFLVRGSLVPFPSLRNLVFDKTNKKKLTLGISPRTALAFVAAYMLTGVVAYSFVVEKWSLVDSLYFSTVCFTTVGYGDLSPTNRLSQLFTGLFGVSGIVLLGSAVATLGSNLVQAQVEAVAGAAAESKKRLMGLFEGMPAALTKHRSRPRGPVTNSYLESLASDSNPLLRRLDDYPQEIKTVKVSEKLRKILPALATVFVGGYITNVLNGGSWTSLDSVYYSLITASTIGFGDLAPRTRSARLFCVVYLPLAVASVGEAISSLALSRLRQRQRGLYEQRLRQNLTLEHLRVMDADGDGFVTREEYVNFMLLEMGVVSEEDLSALQQQFVSLDVSGSGYLDKEDLKLMAELRGATATQQQ